MPIEVGADCLCRLHGHYNLITFFRLIVVEDRSAFCQTRPLGFCFSFLVPVISFARRALLGRLARVSQLGAVPFITTKLAPAVVPKRNPDSHTIIIIQLSGFVKSYRV